MTKLILIVFFEVIIIMIIKFIINNKLSHLTNLKMILIIFDDIKWILCEVFVNCLLKKIIMIMVNVIMIVDMVIKWSNLTFECIFLI